MVEAAPRSAIVSPEVYGWSRQVGLCAANVEHWLWGFVRQDLLTIALSKNGTPEPMWVPAPCLNYFTSNTASFVLEILP